MFEEEHPGLLIWVALLIAGCCIGVFIIKLPSVDQQEKKSLQSWITDQSSLDNIPLVVALGTSLTGAGLDSMNVLEKNISAASGLNTRVLKVWKLDAGPETFSDLSTELRRLHPVIAVVEANMLFYSFSKKKGWPEYTQRFRNFINKKKYYYLPDSKPLVLKRRITELEAFRSGLVDTGKLAAFKDLLVAWQNQGTKILLLNFPLEMPLEARKWNSKDTISFFRNLSYLKEYCRIEYVYPELKLNETNYIDHAHMNNKGQQKQSIFFSNLVAGQLSL